MSPRPPMPVGTYGKITISGDGPYKARARFRDHDGEVRTVARFGQTKTAARNALTTALRDRQRSAGDTINSNTTIAELADAWLADDMVTGLATNSQDAYGYVVRNQIKPALGGVRLAEIGVAVVNRALRAIKTSHGAGAAKTTKTALSGMFKLAIDEEALAANPVRDAISVGASGRKTAVRALTRDEVDDLADRLRSDEPAAAMDLPDLVDFMLATGCRIGEACAIGHHDCPGRDPHASLDLQAGTVEIDSTLVRIKGQGMTVQHRTKTDAGWRVLALPPFAVAMLERRAGELRLRAPHGVAFGSPRKRALRDPSNTAGDLRDVLDRFGYDWVTSHTFRKTVATRMDEAGRSAREIADQLGHAKASMTLDVYMGRNVVSSAVAKILDR